MKINAIVTGATGMVGEGVLLECLAHPDVESVLVLTRRPSGVTHPKLKEIVHSDFQDLSSIKSHLSPYNACFFCLGVSSVGMKEDEYRKLTYDLTMHAARVLSDSNPDMVFCYVSGSGTDSTEKGSSMWGRVKGKTENDLLKLPFKKAYMFRPGYMHPTPGMKNTLRSVKAISWLYPIARPLFPGFVCTLKEVGLAMIHCVTRGSEKQILEVKDIVELSKE
ncbi:MAG TPA: NAD-dependent epimerase/dehydratase family protein [Leptospiraceae bacterium]|nr:NAD-dependent epimerase/dehydratase family protein [Leptospiraceae bacterium]